MTEKLTEANLVSNAWKFYEDEDGIDYRLQFTEVPWKLRRTLLDAMKDWNNVGTGWTKESGNQILIFKKIFRSEEEWKNWADTFPVQIKEMKYWGDKVKVVIHGKKSK